MSRNEKCGIYFQRPEDQQAAGRLWNEGDKAWG